jgi:hypothetical protein
VAFATDSVAVRREIAGLTSDKLGEVKLDKHSKDVIFLANGFYWFNGMWKQRGAGYNREKKVEIAHLDTRAGKDGQLYIAAETNARPTSRAAFVQLIKVCRQDREIREKKSGLNSDRKRMWLDKMLSLQEPKLCDSTPININLVADIIAKKTDIVWEGEQEEGKSDNFERQDG